MSRKPKSVYGSADRVRGVVADRQPQRVALVIHPARSITAPLEILERWAAEHGLDVVQIPALGGSDREVAPRGELEPGDLVVALGGDGTVLSALRAAAPHDAPVLGVACGSLGALTAVHADRLEDALERVLRGDWTARRLPAVAIKPADAADEWAVNDFVVVRRGAGQVVVDVSVDDELYVRLAGDGLVVAASATVRVEVHPSFAGFDVEIDGHTYPLQALDYHLSLHTEKVTLVSFGELGLGIPSLRGRGLIADSPRVLARDERESGPGHH